MSSTDKCIQVSSNLFILLHIPVNAAYCVNWRSVLHRTSLEIGVLAYASATGCKYDRAYVSPWLI